MLHIQRKKVIRPITIILLHVQRSFQLHLSFVGYINVVWFILTLFASTSASAQRELYQTDHDAKRYYFGITLGANVARFKMEPHPWFLERDTVMVAEPLNAGGFELGLSATLNLTPRFEARFNPQLMFTERSISYKLKYPDPQDGTEVTKRIESVIFTFPFQLKFNSDRIGNFRVYMMGGVKADIDLAANARSRSNEDLVKLQKSDYGIEYGVGFNFFFPSFILSPEIKVSNGLRNIHARDENLKYSNVIDRIQSKMIVFCIHLEG